MVFAVQDFYAHSLTIKSMPHTSYLLIADSPINELCRKKLPKEGGDLTGEEFKLFLKVFAEF